MSTEGAATSEGGGGKDTREEQERTHERKETRNDRTDKTRKEHETIERTRHERNTKEKQKEHEKRHERSAKGNRKGVRMKLQRITEGARRGLVKLSCFGVPIISRNPTMLWDVTSMHYDLPIATVDILMIIKFYRGCSNWLRRVVEIYGCKLCYCYCSRSDAFERCSQLACLIFSEVAVGRGESGEREQLAGGV